MHLKQKQNKNYDIWSCNANKIRNNSFDLFIMITSFLRSMWYVQNDRKLMKTKTNINDYIDQ